MTQSKDRQSRTIDLKLAQVLPSYEAGESFEAKAAARKISNPDYWRKNCMEMCRRLKTANRSNELSGIQIRISKEQRERLEGEVNSLGVEVRAARAERDHYKKEAKTLREKLEKALEGE